MGKQRGQIVLYGATGYTGRLAARELADADADFVLSGRNESKLEALAEETGGVAAIQSASLDDPTALRSLLEGAAAVIHCAGPFTVNGEPMLRAAIETGTHYLDTTGEQAYMDLVFRRYGAEAERRGVAAIPAMGHDYAPGDMIASLTAEGMGPLDEIALAYNVEGFTPTHGTLQSTLHVLQGKGEVEFRDGAWRPASQSWGRGSFDFGGDIGEQRMVRYPAGEQVTVPRHVETRNVRTTISASTLAPGFGATLLPYFARPLGLALRSPLKKALDRAVQRLPEGPGEEDRRAVRFTVVCDARAGNDTRRGTVSGSDVYGLTGAIVAQGGLIAAGRGFKGNGALAPAQAFDPPDFLGRFERFDVRWELGTSEAAAPEPVTAPA